MPQVSKHELLSIYSCAVQSVKPNRLIRDSVEILNNGLLRVGHRWAGDRHKVQMTGRDVYLFGAGKAVLGMCEEFLTQIESHNQKYSKTTPISIQAGRLNVPIGTQSTVPNLLSRYHVSTHPCALNNIPDVDASKNTESILEMIDRAKKSHKASSGSVPPLVIGFISGGGSALLSLPKATVSLDDKRSLIGDLVRAGADIVELNTVRGAISQVKGGQLAQRICCSPSPCQLVTLIISDIIHDPVDMIASGPTVPQSAHAQTPLSILDKYNIKPKENIYNTISNVPEIIPNPKFQLENIIIGNNSIALSAAETELRKLKLKVIQCGSNICGEASDVVKSFLKRLSEYENSDEMVEDKKQGYRGVAWLAGGETTVTMDSCDKEKLGLGGRCQEMGLHFLNELIKSHRKYRMHGLFAGTDGQDGPTPCAGVLLSYPIDLTNLDSCTVQQSISTHDSHNYFRVHLPQSLIETGLSGTNVMDIYCLVCEFD